MGVRFVILDTLGFGTGLPRVYSVRHNIKLTYQEKGIYYEYDYR